MLRGEKANPPIAQVPNAPVIAQTSLSPCTYIVPLGTGTQGGTGEGGHGVK